MQDNRINFIDYVGGGYRKYYRADKWQYRMTCITVVKSQNKMLNENNKQENKLYIADTIYVKIVRLIIIVYIVYQYILM